MDQYSISRQRFFLGVFLLILVAGIGLRVFEFSDTLVFKSDQARDALMMERVFSGEAIPLLGPQVGGTPLRLGPVTYYFQYVSGLLFGDNPESFAYPDVFFGILTLPLLFLFLRRFFATTLSLFLTALGSISFVLVTFSRFAWNPNSLPFFTTLFAYTFFLAEESKGRRRSLFIVLSAVTFAIIFQLHVAASFGLTLGLLGYLFWYRSFSVREVVLVLFFVMVLHFPMIKSELQSGGENTRLLWEEFGERGTENGKHNVLEKSFRSFQQGAQFVWLLTTGELGPKNIETRGFAIKCDKECRRDLPLSSMIIVSFLVLAFLARREFAGVMDIKKKRELTFLFLWFFGFALFTIPIAYELETRFYLGIITPLFVFFGLSFQALGRLIKNKALRYFVVAMGVTLLVLQFQTTTRYLSEMKQARVSAVESHEDLRFGTAPKVTLRQLRDIAGIARDTLDVSAPVFVSGENLYVKSLYYVLSHEYGFAGCYMRGEKNAVPENMSHILLRYTDEADALASAADFQEFGTLSISVEPPLFQGDTAMPPQNCLNY